MAQMMGRNNCNSTNSTVMVSTHIDQKIMERKIIHVDWIIEPVTVHTNLCYKHIKFRGPLKWVVFWQLVLCSVSKRGFILF